MRVRTNELTNVTFAVACVIITAAGVLQLWEWAERRWRQTDSPLATSISAVERVQDVVIDTQHGTVRLCGAPQVALVEFSDFQCPFCGQYARETYPQIIRDFVETGVAAYAFFNFPLERIHPLARAAGESAECAGRQNKFWEMHDILFASPSAVTRKELLDHALRLGIGLDAFRECLDGGAPTRVRQQIEIAHVSGVKSTPTFFIGRLDATQRLWAEYRVLGAQPYSVIARALKNALAAK
ncbi:MAG TPA: DsbA family protein [Vicinamibacterales bacterium]|nr:DsbA family protein [Vicinamibacterales bacterium]